MEKLRTHYDNLQVVENASMEVIKGAYRYLSQKWHPDKNPDNRETAERITKIINEAYEVLSDPVQRQQHDNWIREQREQTKQQCQEPPPTSDSLKETLPNIDGNNCNLSLWNPNTAANWSLLFTPVFGAWLNAKNWSELGNIKKQRQSMIWVYCSAVLLLIAFFSPDNIGRGIGFWLLIGWYFSNGKSQIKFFKENLGNNYTKKSFGKPLGIAILTVCGIFGISMVYYMFDTETQMENALTEISGVWRYDEDGTIITFKLATPTKSIDFGGKSIEVIVNNFDNDNKILTLSSTKYKPSFVLAVRQIFQEKGFTLHLTFDNGAQRNLSFVRLL